MDDAAADDDTAPLTRNAQRTPTVTFARVAHHQPGGYAEVGQHEADDEAGQHEADDEVEVTQCRAGAPLGHFRSGSLRGQRRSE